MIDHSGVYLPTVIWLQALFGEPLTVGFSVLGLAIGWMFSGTLKSRLRAETMENVWLIGILALTSAVMIFLLVTWNPESRATTVGRILESSGKIGVRLVFTVLLFVIAYTLVRMFRRLLLNVNQSTVRVMSDHQRRISFYVSQVTIYFLTILVVLTVWGVQLSNLLIGAGVLGIILGLAAQETLSSILAGFMLMLSRPFQVGNWVQIGEHEGFITDITINNVRIRNHDGEHVVIPNEIVNNRTIINRSYEGKQRVRIEIGIDYGVAPERAESVALEAISDLDKVMSQPSPDVVPVRFDNSAIILELRVWIDRPTPQRKWRAIQAVIHAVKQAFEQEGIKIPFPQREIGMRTGTERFRVVESGSHEQLTSDTDQPS